VLYAQSAITVISITISARDYDGRSAFMTMIMMKGVLVTMNRIMMILRIMVVIIIAVMS